MEEEVVLDAEMRGGKEAEDGRLAGIRGGEGLAGGRGCPAAREVTGSRERMRAREIEMGRDHGLICFVSLIWAGPSFRPA
jgi:hypothetical protein